MQPFPISRRSSKQPNGMKQSVQLCLPTNLPRSPKLCSPHSQMPQSQQETVTLRDNLQRLTQVPKFVGILIHSLILVANCLIIGVLRVSYIYALNALKVIASIIVRVFPPMLIRLTQKFVSVLQIFLRVEIIIEIVIIKTLKRPIVVVTLKLIS